jgi:glycosyltransferase involved in cell wall biosynthesis
MELISVIVPSFNHAQFLEQRLKSIYKQSYDQFEVIILDDCSTDNSRAIIDQYKTHPKTAHIIFNEQNSGSAFTQWKKGISLAKGKYIWVAESDDFCELNFLEVAAAKLDEGFDLFYSKTTRVEADGSVMKNNQYRWYNDISETRWLNDFENDAKEEVRDVLFTKCIINNASAVVFRNEKRIFGYLDQVSGMYYSGDWLFWILYLLDSKRLCYSTKTVNYFRTHPAVTRLQSPAKRNPEMLRIFKFIVNHPLSEGKRKFLADYFFDKHIFKGNKRELGKNILLAIRMCFASSLFIRPWFRYYFTSNNK